MIFSKQTIYIENNKEEIPERTYKNLSIIILREDLYIKIISINKKDNLNNILKENIANTFKDYEVLVHYEFMKDLGKRYMIIYFLKYSQRLKERILAIKDLKISPYQFKCTYGKRRKGINIILIDFRDTIYLIIKLKGKILYGKNISPEEYYIESIENAIESINHTLNLKDKKRILFVSEKLYNDDFTNKFYKINIINKRWGKIYIKDYKKFLPKEYVKLKNKTIYKSILMLIFLLIAINLILFTMNLNLKNDIKSIIKRNNYNKEYDLNNNFYDVLYDIESIYSLMNDSNINYIILENRLFSLYTKEDYINNFYSHYKDNIFIDYMSIDNEETIIKGVIKWKKE